jgi:ABC-type glycerol-3-phosphate transport system substrate-binding protein
MSPPTVLGMRSLFRPLAFLLIAAAAALTGCGFRIEPVVQLITNRAEMAAYVDRYNAIQSDVKVEISYQDTPSQAVLDGTPGDAVVGQWLATPAVMDRLDALGDIVKPGKVDPAWFYTGLLAMGSRDNRPFLIPISFTLPAIVYMRTSADLPNKMFMPLDDLQSMSKAFNKTSKTGLPIAMGFSPLGDWNADFLTTSALLFGARFRPGRNDLPAYDDNGLSKTTDFVRMWLNQVNGGAAADAAFSSRNRVQPWYKLLSSGKTLFALASFRDFFALPVEKRHDLDFRWLSQDNIIPVMDDVLFGGVLRSSRNKGEARAFLQWFSSPAVQQTLLNVNQLKRIGVFGVTDGFSALKTINERDLPQKYPILLGHIPLDSILSFPGLLPDNWVKVRDSVVMPWIAQTASGQESRPLDKTLDEWQKAEKK